MPRGKKKAIPETTPAPVTALTETNVDQAPAPVTEEKAAPAPAEVKADEKPKTKTERKAKTKKDDTAKTVEIAEKATDKPKAKAGRKATAKKEDKTVPAKKTDKASTKAPTEKPKKPTNKKAAVEKSEDVVFQSGGNDYSLSDITELCKKAYRNGGKKQIKTIRVYVKPENGKLRAYYVVNGNADGAFIEL